MSCGCDGATCPCGPCSLTSVSVKFDFSHRTNVSVLFWCALLPEFVALYAYKSPQAGDLTFTEGDVILVSKREGEWWNGSTGDRTGLFPHNYVKPKEADVRTPSMHSRTHNRLVTSKMIVLLCTRLPE